MHKYVRNMHEICNYMSEICIKYAQYIDCISHIWKKYALNMPEICTNMQIICSYMLKICSYMPKICNKYAQYIDCISRICKKYAVKICRNMQFYMQNMHKSIYCIYCIYMHSPLCWWNSESHLHLHCPWQDKTCIYWVQYCTLSTIQHNFEIWIVLKTDTVKYCLTFSFHLISTAANWFLQECCTLSCFQSCMAWNICKNTKNTSVDKFSVINYITTFFFISQYCSHLICMRIHVCIYAYMQYVFPRMAVGKAAQK